MQIARSLRTRSDATRSAILACVGVNFFLKKGRFEDTAASNSLIQVEKPVLKG